MTFSYALNIASLPDPIDILFKKMFLGSCMVMRLIFRGFSIANRKTAIANPIEPFSQDIGPGTDIPIEVPFPTHLH